jgi:hypothetical protein
MNEFILYSSNNSYADTGAASKENRSLPVDTKEINVFFVNSGGKLNNVSEQSGLNLLGNSRSCTIINSLQVTDTKKHIENMSGL